MDFSAAYRASIGYLILSRQMVFTRAGIFDKRMARIAEYSMLEPPLIPSVFFVIVFGHLIPPVGNGLW